MSKTLDGTKKRRPPVLKPRTQLDKHIKVMPIVMAVAKKHQRTGERLEIVSETCVRLVPASPK